MKKKKPNNDITSREKQILSIEKAVSMAVITVTGLLHEKKLKEEDYEKNMGSRLRAVQQKYGFNFLKQVLPGIIKRMSDAPRINMKLSKGKKNLKLRSEYLNKYMEFLEGEK